MRLLESQSWAKASALDAGVLPLSASLDVLDRPQTDQVSSAYATQCVSVLSPHPHGVSVLSTSGSHVKGEQ